MANKATVTFNIDQDVKEKAAEIFSSLGMNFTTGLDVYLRAVVRTGGIPFTLSSSDTQPVQAMSLSSRIGSVRETSQELSNHDTLEQSYHDTDIR